MSIKDTFIDTKLQTIKYKFQVTQFNKISRLNHIVGLILIILANNLNCNYNM